MNITEYKQVENLDYDAYCNYLQEKYGIGKGNYFLPSWSKNRKVPRTKEGLVTHHKMEDRAIKLADAKFAKLFPIEYQAARNLVYCDLLEHVLLHILICELPEKPEKPEIPTDTYEGLMLSNGYTVGISGLKVNMIPELIDYYSGWRSKQEWQKSCLGKIEGDKAVFFELIKRFKRMYPIEDIHKSFNANYGIWSEDKNEELFDVLKRL